MNEKVTLKELNDLKYKIDTEAICVNSFKELHLQLNTKYTPEKWTMFRAPFWIGENLVVTK